MTEVRARRTLIDPLQTHGLISRPSSGLSTADPKQILHVGASSSAASTSTTSSLATGPVGSTEGGGGLESEGVSGREGGRGMSSGCPRRASTSSRSRQGGWVAGGMVDGRKMSRGRNDGLEPNQGYRTKDVLCHFPLSLRNS